MPLSYRPENAYATIGGPRTPWLFKKKALMIVTGNCGDEYRELMGDPCFEMMEGQFMIEQVETIDKFYVGGVENMPEETSGKNYSMRITWEKHSLSVSCAEGVKTKNFNKGRRIMSLEKYRWDLVNCERCSMCKWVIRGVCRARTGHAFVLQCRNTSMMPIQLRAALTWRGRFSRAR